MNISRFFQTLLFVSLFSLFIILSSLIINPPPTFAAKRIEVNLKNQRLYAYDDQKLIYNFLISSGKWAPTPTGTFRPWAKLPSTTMKGGNKQLGTYYNLPNVPHVIYFYQGYAIHGTYWHNNFGTPMSHGCVNLSIADAQAIYNFVDFSTPIVIF